MSADLSGTSVLVVVTNYGAERDELIVPIKELGAAGATVTVATPQNAPITTLVMDVEPGETVQPDTTFDTVDPGAYDALVIPGGTLNADAIRLQPKALEFVRAFVVARKPVAAICHGPWLLVEAGLVAGKTLTSYPSVRTDVVNAGGTWVDEEVVTDDSDGWTLITSRTPADLPAFTTAVTAALTGRGQA